MTDQKSSPRTPVIPTMRYADAPRMIEWLCTAFGFERHFVVPGDNGTIAHAQLSFGNGMIMLGSAQDDEWGRLVKPVGSSAATASVYVVVADPDAHAARARAAGAEIIEGPRNTDYGSREYAARDPEGGIWSFGSYDPWA